MLAQRHRRWANINPALDQRLEFAVTLTAETNGQRYSSQSNIMNIALELGLNGKIVFRPGYIHRNFGTSNLLNDN